MIDFQRLDVRRRAEYDRYLRTSGKGCEYTFVNLSIWGKQQAAFIEDSLVLFSQFGRSSVYPFPIIRGEARPVLDALIADARERGIRCRLTGMNQADCDLLSQLYPGQFRVFPDRDGYDYVYSIDALADLKGRKLQKKRNHLNRFRTMHPDCRVVPIDLNNLCIAQQMVDRWFDYRLRLDPDQEPHLERMALHRAFSRFQELELDGILLMEGDDVIAMTMGSRMNEDTFDIHFEKAREDIDGAYAAVNSAFAVYLREKYPDIRYLDREDDMGLPGLRKAKLSYYPEFLIEKSWAALTEEEDDY